MPRNALAPPPADSGTSVAATEEAPRTTSRDCAAVAVWITQRNCLAVLGLTPSAYLARVKAWKIPADRGDRGKDQFVITELADWQRAREARLDRAANDSAPLTGADALLASIGLKRRAGGAR